MSARKRKRQGLRGRIFFERAKVVAPNAKCTYAQAQSTIAEISAILKGDFECN